MDIEDVYDEFEGRLRRFALTLVRDLDAVDDLVQETFIRAMAHTALLERLNRHQRRAWLFRVLKNVFIDERRAEQRRGQLVEQVGFQTEFTGEMASDIVSTDILNGVNEQDRTVLEMRYVQGMTSTEISEDLGVPAATVRSRLYLAIKRLRNRQSEFR